MKSEVVVILGLLDPVEFADKWRRFLQTLLGVPVLADESLTGSENDLEVKGKYERPLATLATKETVNRRRQSKLWHVHQPTNIPETGVPIERTNHCQTYHQVRCVWHEKLKRL